MIIADKLCILRRSRLDACLNTNNDELKWLSDV